MVGLVHWHADPGGSGWRVCLPLRSLHNGLQPSQVSLKERLALAVLVQDVQLIVLTPSLLSKEICEANTTIMCPMCEDTCKPWTLSDSCVYAKVGAFLKSSGFLFLTRPRTTSSSSSKSYKCLFEKRRNRFNDETGSSAKQILDLSDFSD